MSGAVVTPFSAQFNFLDRRTSRCRRLLGRLQNETEGYGVYTHHQRESLARRWAKRDEQAQKHVREIFGAAGWSEDAIASQTFIQNIENFERADRMIMAYQRHRNSLKRRIERHREDKTSRQSTSDAQQVDTEILSDQASSKNGAA